jgi:hypothetical protein
MKKKTFMKYEFTKTFFFIFRFTKNEQHQYNRSNAFELSKKFKIDSL